MIISLFSAQCSKIKVSHNFCRNYFAKSLIEHFHGNNGINDALVKVH